MSLAKLSAKKLTENAQQELVQSLLSDLVVLGGVQEILLFGSAARLEMTEASDIDVVAIFDTHEVAREGAKKFHKNRTALWPTDVLFVDRNLFEARSILGGVLFVARDEGKSIYKRKST